MLLTYICNTKCLWKGKLYYDGEYYDFDPSWKPPKHFSCLASGSQALKDTIAKLEEDIIRFEKEDSKNNPHPAEVAEYENKKKKVKELRAIK